MIAAADIVERSKSRFLSFPRRLRKLAFLLDLWIEVRLGDPFARNFLAPDWLRFRAGSWLILSIPLIAHGSAMVSLLLARYEGWRLADTVEIKNYKETPILWPGFDGPIGLEVTLELHHAAGIKALILSPEIRMGPVLSFSEAEVTPLAYALLPGTVDYLPDPKQICLNSRSYGIALCTAEQKPEMGCASKNYSPVTDPIYNLGSNLSALWIAAGAYDMTADLSSKLDAILRHESILQGKPTEWTEIQKRLEPKGLAAAGYRLCAPGPDSHTAFRTCYCLDE